MEDMTALAAAITSLASAIQNGCLVLAFAGVANAILRH